MGKIELLDGNISYTRSKTAFIHSRVIYIVFQTGSAPKLKQYSLPISRKEGKKRI